MEKKVFKYVVVNITFFMFEENIYKVFPKNLRGSYEHPSHLAVATLYSPEAPKLYLL